VSRHSHDIDALYELVLGVDRKIDTLTAEVGTLRAGVGSLTSDVGSMKADVGSLTSDVRSQAATTDAKLDEILRALRDR
jgi:outer membrane murein-binding lipoprotein Lpp